MKSKIIATLVLSACSFPVLAHSNYQSQINQLKADIHTVHMNTLQKYSESWGLEDRANIAELKANKVDKSVFAADQKRQDEHINAVQGAAQQANEKADAGAVRADRIEAQAGLLDSRVGKTETRLDVAESGLRDTNAQVEYNNSYANSRIDAANQVIEANHAAQVATNKRVAEHSSALANHEQRIGDLEQSTNRNFANLNKRVGEVHDKANAGTSAALAASGIPQVTGEQRFSLGAGVGGYEGEKALAVGFSSRVTSAVVVKASVTTDSQHGFGYNAGVSVGW